MSMDIAYATNKRKATVKVRHLSSFSQLLNSELSNDFDKSYSTMLSPSQQIEGPAEYSPPDRTDQYDNTKLQTEIVRKDSREREKNSLILKDDHIISSEKDIDNKLLVITNYWRQLQTNPSEADSISQTLTLQQIKKRWSDVEKSKEVLYKWSVRQEILFIKKNFHQRRCKVFCKHNHIFKDKVNQCLRKYNLSIPEEKQFCQCGLEKELHGRDASSLGLNKSTSEWSIATHTEKVLPWNFGNVDMPGNYSYLDLPEGTRKYIRLDDLTTHSHQLWELLTTHWRIRKPKMVISITGGDCTPLFANNLLHKQFRDGIIKTAVNTKSWVITEGLHMGSAKEIGDIFQEDLKRSEWSEIEDNANIPLIAIGPWGITAGLKSLEGIYVGSMEAKYNFTLPEGSTSSLKNTLDPYHTVYILADNGTYGTYLNEPKIRKNLEKYIKTRTTIETLGEKGVCTPVVIVVMAGDVFTLQKVAEAVAEEVEISVVIVNGSGPIADMLAHIYKSLESLVSYKDKKIVREWTEKEDMVLNREILQYRTSGVLTTNEEEKHLKDFMKGRHLVQVFGVDHGDKTSLDKAILEAVFAGVTEISTQLNLTLALDRVGIARETIFIESRKDELRTPGLVENALFVSLKSGKPEFTQLLLDQDFGGQLNFPTFVTLDWLHALHKENLNPTNPMAKVLRSLTKKDIYGSDDVMDDNLLPQIGRIVYMLMGDNYRLLYQENEYRKVCDDQLPWTLSSDEREEAVWHIFIWAVLGNKKEIAELFLFESSCKLGLALVAYKMLTELAKVADIWHETELCGDLKENASYFQNLAVETLDNLYEMNREEAYANIVSLIPFHWGLYTTPLSIADDAEAKRFIGHACCQTFLNLLWMKYMDLDTSKWKLVPIFALFPFINIPLITFDKKNLSFGSYKDVLYEQEENNGVTKQGSTEEDNDTSFNFENANCKDDEGSVFSETLPHRTEKRQLVKRLKFAWFCIKNYYTAPVNIFLHGLVTYIIFLGIFTHFVLSELKPLVNGDLKDVTLYEWITYAWVASVVCQEFAQLMARKSSGPLYNLPWITLEPKWKKTWHWHERLKFVFRIHKLSLWLSDRWNKIDLLMIFMFITSVTLRFTLQKIEFGVVRMFFCGTLILYYIRLLRFGYIMRTIGPRIITIREMMGDLFQFLLILSIFIISFGVTFQALLDPNKPPSWDLLVDVLWRSYWQMYGELLIDSNDMGRSVDNRNNCTSDRQLAETYPEQYEYCHSWMALIFLAVYMLITNILLLNLLIAIFSNSFEKIESEAIVIWRYNVYDLVHEYYHHVWLPPPLNVICHFVNITLWLLKWPRRLLFISSMKRNSNRVHSEVELDTGSKQRQFIIQKETEDAVKKECCSFFYYDHETEAAEQVDHFRQEEYMRNEDIEEMAYKRYMRVAQKNKEKQSKVKDMLKLQSSRLQAITLDLTQVKHQTSNASSTQYVCADEHAASTVSARQRSSNAANGHINMEMLNSKVDNLAVQVETLAQDIHPLLKYVKRKLDKKNKKDL